MKIRRQHLIVTGIILLGITFLTIGVLHQSEPTKYYAHSLRHWQEADSVAGYPIAIHSREKEHDPEFITTQFQPNLSTMSPMEQFRLPTARSFQRFPTTQARAVATGLVLYTGNPSGYLGKAVLLGHRLPNGDIIQSFYSGLQRISVKVGQHIPRGGSLGLGEGSVKLELREGVAIDIALEQIGGIDLNSQNTSPAPNRLDLEDFFKTHPLASSTPDPLAIIQANKLSEARRKLGLEE